MAFDSPQIRAQFYVLVDAMARLNQLIGVPPAQHRCIEHLVRREHEWHEPHGEPCHQEWLECSVCGAHVEEDDAD